MTLDAYLTDKLAQREQAGLYRSRHCIEQNHDGILSSDNAHYLDFASNDYLGLRAHPEVLQAWVEGLALYGAGSGASPLVTGYMAPHRQLETQIATSLGRDAALLFSSGFAANQALCRALFSQGGQLFCDKLMHASFIDGALASAATFKRFKHNDLSHLQSLLASADKNAPLLVATESVFSMDGDTPDMRGLVKLCQKYQATLMIDDAHGIGVLGAQNGLGSVEQFQLSQNDAPIVMGTLGKSLGASGAFIAGSQVLIDYLVNFARDYIYSTAMPPAQACGVSKAWQLMTEGTLTKQLRSNIAYFRQRASEHDITLAPSASAIQLIYAHNPEQVMAWRSRLESLGIWVGAMRAPTVPVGTDRLRITLRATQSQQDIDALVDALKLVVCIKDKGGDDGTHP